MEIYRFGLLLLVASRKLSNQQCRNLVDGWVDQQKMKYTTNLTVADMPKNKIIRCNSYYLTKQQ